MTPAALVPLAIASVKIGFLPVSVFDLLDVAVVAYILYQVYKLLRGSVAVNILIGIATLFGLYFLVQALGMEMLSALLTQFVSVGVIIIIIIFQPEIRRFLVVLGNNALRQRSNVLQRLFRLGGAVVGNEGVDAEQQEIHRAMVGMAKERTGALIVVTRNPKNEPLGASGTRVNAEVSEPLLRTIFDKHTPLHDGAVIVANGKIWAAGCVLPVSDRSDLPQSVGLRHRAAVGLTERSQAVAFVVSEESGAMSFASGGKLFRRISENRLAQELAAAYG